SQDIPTGIEADDYTVDVKYVDSLGNHEDLTGVTVPVTIAPATAPAADSLDDSYKPSAIDNLTYTGSEQTLVTPPSALHDGYDQVWFSTDGGDTWSQDLPTGIGADDYTVSVKYVDSLGNHQDLTGVTVPVTIAPAAAPNASDLNANQKPTPISGLTYTGSAQQLVNPPSVKPDNYEQIWYSTDGGNTWSQNLPTGINATDYDISVKYVDTDGNYEDLTGVTVTATINPAASAFAFLTEDNKPHTASGLYYTSNPQVLVVGPSEMPANYETIEYSVDGGNTWVAEPTGTENGNYPVAYRYIDEDGNYQPITGGSLTATIYAAQAPNPSILTDEQKPHAVADLTYDGQSHELVSAPTGTLPNNYEKVMYSTDGGTTWSDAIPAKTSADDYTVNYKYVDTDGAYADLIFPDSIPVSIAPAPAPDVDTLPDDQKPAAIDGLEYTGSAQDLIDRDTPATLPDGYDQIWYSTDGGSTWSQNIPTGTDAGDYEILYKYVDADEDHEDITGGSVTVSIAPADAPSADSLTDANKPSAVDDLAYTGSAQNLVTPPSTLPEGYDQVWYSTDGGNTWSQTIPTGTDAGDYEVSVKYVDSNGNHDDLTGVTVPVTIAPAEAPDASSLTAAQKPTAVNGLAYTGSEQELVNAPSSLPAGYDEVWYSTDGGNTWSQDIPTGIEAGNYTVSVKYVDTDGNYEDLTGITVPVTIAQEAAPELTDAQKPSAVSGLTYTGSAQALVSAPASLPDGYEQVWYSLDGGNTWTQTIPTGTDAGTYTISVRYVDTDGIKADILGSDITVTIAAGTTTAVINGVAQTVTIGSTLARPEDPTRYGYDFTGWFADEACTIPYNFNTPVGVNGVTLYAGWAQVSYSLTEGGESTWNSNSDSTLTFRAVRNRLEPTTFSHFTGIQVDGKDVSKDNYQAKSGSVIVTLNESYLKTLSAGEHTLDIMFDDAPSVRTTFTIVAAQVPSTGETAYSAYSILGALLIASAAAFVIYSARHEEA
ncbi:LPXTG-motif cell wall anchor domain-containing protein/Listeria/Bacterioides repeat-containing protein, partial [Ruminococcaceae bacterium KH2T8]